MFPFGSSRVFFFCFVGGVFLVFSLGFLVILLKPLAFGDDFPKGPNTWGGTLGAFLGGKTPWRYLDP